MKTLSRQKNFVKDIRNARLTEGRFTKLFLYVADLLNNKTPVYTKSRTPSLVSVFRQFLPIQLIFLLLSPMRMF